MLKPDLSQRGRASIDFLAEIYSTFGMLHKGVEMEMADKGITAETLPDDMDARHAWVEEALADSKTLKVQQQLFEWSQKLSGLLCTEAFEEIRPQLEPGLRALDNGPATLDYGNNNPPPDYWPDVWFHRTAGGWDATEFHGYVHAELIHPKLVSRHYPAGIFAQRKAAAEFAPRRDYRRILDIGTSSGHFTLMLQEVFPQAEIWGVDLSRRMLEHARRAANAKGYAWKLFVRPGEDTGFPDQHFDLVASYILLHEIPAPVIRTVFEEAFRMLTPGGDLMFSDVPRNADLDRMQSWRLDWVARNAGEPYWREAAEIDLKALAEAVGFTAVEIQAVGPGQYPYMIRAHKPEA
jgi:SAM-dependent methyltransferase